MQTFTVPSIEADRTCSSVGLNSQDQTVPVCPWKQKSSALFAQSHTRIVLSSEPDTNCLPSWEKLQLNTALVWLRSVQRFLPCSLSHTCRRISAAKAPA